MCVKNIRGEKISSGKSDVFSSSLVGVILRRRCAADALPAKKLQTTLTYDACHVQDLYLKHFTSKAY
jgi:hypothetical protein